MKNEMRYYVPNGREDFLCHCTSIQHHFYDFFPLETHRSGSACKSSFSSYQQSFLSLSCLNIVAQPLSIFLRLPCSFLQRLEFFGAVIDHLWLCFVPLSFIWWYRWKNSFFASSLSIFAPCSAYHSGFYLAMKPAAICDYDCFQTSLSLDMSR